MKSIAPVLLACLLCACGHVPLSTALALRDLDPSTADPAAMAVAVRLPASLALQAGKTRLTLGGTREDTKETIDEIFVLRPQPPVGDVDGLPDIGDDEHLVLLAVSRQDIERLRQTQMRIRQWKAARPDGTRGRLSLSAAPCRQQVDVTGPLPVSTYIRTRSNAAFIPLTTDIDARDLSPLGLPACELAISPTDPAVGPGG